MFIYKLVFLLVLVGPSTSWGQTPISKDEIESIKERLEKLEDSNSQTMPSVERVFSKRFQLGGDLNLTATDIFENAGARFSGIEFQLRPIVQFTDDWKAFAELDFSNFNELQNPDSTQRSWGQADSAGDVERAYLEFTGFSRVTMTFGQFFSYFGSSNRVHEPPIFITPVEPIFLLNGTIARITKGVSASGKIGSLFEYNLYGGQGADLDSDNFTKAPAVGGVHLSYDIPFPGEATIGVSYQTSQRDMDSAPYNAFGLNSKIEWKSLSARLDALIDSTNRLGLFLVPGLRLGQYLLYYAYDQGDINTQQTAADDRIQHHFGVNYLIRGNLRLKLEINRISYSQKQDSNLQNKDYTSVVSQAAFAF